MGIIHAGQVYAYHSVHGHYSVSERENKLMIILLHIYYSHNISNALKLLRNTQRFMPSSIMWYSLTSYSSLYTRQ